LSALFADQDHYYAILVSSTDCTRGMVALRDYLIADQVTLAHSDVREWPDNPECEYRLRAFPILALERAHEFYQHITPEIAAYFLKANQLYFDDDFISDKSKKLFVFTKSILHAVPQNNENGRKLFPEFYSRLDKLVKEEIGKATTLDLQVIHEKPAFSQYLKKYLNATLFSRTSAITNNGKLGKTSIEISDHTPSVR
jgi:hypothetical protein